jgi:hypothetical protein
MPASKETGATGKVVARATWSGASKASEVNFKPFKNDPFAGIKTGLLLYTHCVMQTPGACLIAY